MAILKTTYGSTGHTSYEEVDSILDTGSRTIRVYSDDGIQERELCKGDRVELISGTVCIHAEDCPDAGVLDVAEGEVTVRGSDGKHIEIGADDKKSEDTPRRNQLLSDQEIVRRLAASYPRLINENGFIHYFNRR